MKTRNSRFAQPTGKTTDFAISADGTRLFAATFEPEAGVLVWDLVNGLYLARLAGDDSSAMSLELLAGDTRLALTTRRANLIFYETRLEPLRRWKPRNREFLPDRIGSCGRFSAGRNLQPGFVQSRLAIRALAGASPSRSAPPAEGWQSGRMHWF